jgi:DNA-binding transcriptional LysR family regulator
MLLERIELFVNVARHQNLGRTARELHVSASSVCQRLKSLENDFGAKLYRKNKDGIELTEAGQTFLGTASGVLNQLETLRKTFHPQSEVANQTLIVGGTYNPSVKYLPRAIAVFTKTHPAIEVRFITSDGPTLEKSVRQTGIDIAIFHNPSNSSDFNMEHFAVDHLSFFAHPTHPLAKKKKLDLDDLTHTPIIVRDAKAATDKMLKAIKSRGLTVNIALRCASPDAVKAAVRKRMGVGILFHNLIEEEIKRNEVKVLRFAGLPPVVGNSYIVYKKTKPLTAPATEFLALLREMKCRQKRPVNIRKLTGTDPS